MQSPYTNKLPHHRVYETEIQNSLRNSIVDADSYLLRKEKGFSEFFLPNELRAHICFTYKLQFRK
jgi:hypothetical protein